MTPRENLKRLLRREGFAYIPTEFSLCPSLILTYLERTGGSKQYQQFFEFPWKNAPDPIPRDLDVSRFSRYYDKIDEKISIDQWGVAHVSEPAKSSMPRFWHPLENAADADEIDAYPMPAFFSGNNRHIRAAVSDIHQKGLASMGNLRYAVWETARRLRGRQHLLADMQSESEIAIRLFARIEREAIARAKLLARAGVDILFLGDDIGDGQQMLYRTWIFPCLKRTIEEARRVNPSIIIAYHSGGNIAPLIPDLIEAGVDVLSPIPPESMDFERVHAEYGDALSFHGTIAMEATLALGTAAEVAHAVRKNLSIAGKRGGLFPAPTHQLEAHVPWENVLAYVGACQGYA